MLRDEDRELARGIGVRARSFRVRLHATQEQVAEQVNLSPQVYARLEQGRVLPSVRTLVRLAEALNVAPGRLLGDLPGEEEPPFLARVVDTPRPRRGRPAAAKSPVDFELATLERYARQLDPATREHLVALARKLSEAS